MSFITNSKEAKYKKTTDLNDKDLSLPGVVKETQITSLPEILKMPRECYDDQNKKQSQEPENKKEDKNEFNSKDKLEKIRNFDHFFFAVAKQNVSIVNKVTGQEYMIIQQRAINENDRISGAFLTYYQYSEQDSLNVSVYKKIRQLSLHYFESFYDYKNVLLNSTYTIFDMTDDFIEMMMKCEEIIPHAKNRLVNRITQFKEETEDVANNVRDP